MSSWSGYIDNLMGCGHLESVAILGIDGSVWACSKDFKIDRSEADTIAHAFLNSSSLAGSGINLNGKKFFFLQGDDKQIQCRKGPSGVTMAKSNQCILIGTYNDQHQPGQARNAVEKMGDYLRDSNY